MKTETFDNAADFMQALHGKKHQKRHQASQDGPGRTIGAKSTRSRGERIGLTTLLLQGWCNEYDGRMRMRLYRGTVTTAFYDDEKAACDAAKALS